MTNAMSLEALFSWFLLLLYLDEIQVLFGHISSNFSNKFQNKFQYGGPSLSLIFVTKSKFAATETTKGLGSSTKAQAAQAYSLYFVWNFGSELFIRLCMGIYQIFQNGRICAEMLK